MGDDKKKKEKKKKGLLTKLFLFFFVFGGAGGGAGYYFKPDLFKKWFAKAKTSLQKAKDKIDDKLASEVEIKGQKLKVTVAKTEARRKKGFKGQESIGKDEGILFVYEEKTTPSFWMKGCLVPLSIAFLSDEGKILEIQKMEVEKVANPKEHTYTTYKPSQPIKYAIEVKQGWFEKHNVSVGDQFKGIEKVAK